MVAGCVGRCRRSRRCRSSRCADRLFLAATEAEGTHQCSPVGRQSVSAEAGAAGQGQVRLTESGTETLEAGVPPGAAPDQYHQDV